MKVNTPEWKLAPHFVTGGTRSVDQKKKTAYRCQYCQAQVYSRSEARSHFFENHDGVAHILTRFQAYRQDFLSSHLDKYDKALLIELLDYMVQELDSTAKALKGMRAGVVKMSEILTRQ